MKKFLLALAVLGAFLGAALAQTSVTLYGRVDSGVGVAHSDAPGTNDSAMLWSGVQSATRFGVRGSEDLGSGLRVLFNVESGIEIDTGAASNGTRFWARVRSSGWPAASVRSTSAGTTRPGTGRSARPT